MPSFDSASLLSQFNRFTGRPSSSDTVSDADKYIRLSEGQNRVVQDMFARVPQSLYPKTANLPTMTSTAGGNIFTFGTDPQGFAITPMGKTRIFPDQQSFPDFPWLEGVDYVNEGTQIRLPNGRTWAGTLYWYGIAAPADITALIQPALFPPAFRDLIVFQAVIMYGYEGKRDTELAERFEQKYAQRFAEGCLAWKTQFSSGGALGSWTGLRLAEAGFSAQ
jgi:hypothetical protein